MLSHRVAVCLVRHNLNLLCYWADSLFWRGLRFSRLELIVVIFGHECSLLHENGYLRQLLCLLLRLPLRLSRGFDCLMFHYNLGLWLHHQCSVAAVVAIYLYLKCIRLWWTRLSDGFGCDRGIGLGDLLEITRVPSLEVVVIGTTTRVLLACHAGRDGKFYCFFL